MQHLRRINRLTSDYTMPRATVLRINSVELLPFITLHIHGTYTYVIHKLISRAKSVIGLCPRFLKGFHLNLFFGKLI